MEIFAEFRMPQTIFYGRHSYSKIGNETKGSGKKALIISDRTMEKLGNIEECIKHFNQAGVTYISYLDVNSEPTDVHVEQSLNMFLREQCEVIVAIGGGSCLDAAKAVAVLATNGGYIGDYMNGNKNIDRKPIPMIAVPTTAGTGSETTSVTVIINTKEDIKMMIKHPFFIPTVAIVDPILTISSPSHVTAATGIDALCHAIEAYISSRSHPITDTLALSSIELIGQNIRKAYYDGDDIDARENMLLASMKAGIAFSNASVCLVHGMSRPIGAVFHVPHGVSNAMLLPAVLEFSKDSCVNKLATIGRILNHNLIASSDQEAAEGAIFEIKQLCSDLNIPNMQSWGIDRERFKNIVAKMAVDALTSGSPAHNPKVPTEEEILNLYHTCYDYDFHAENKRK
jgi:alcohol dehydrogenase class IV